MNQLYISIFILLTSCSMLKEKEVKPVNQFVFEWENMILKKAIEVNTNGDCDPYITAYKKYNRKPHADDYHLVSLFNYLLAIDKISSLSDSFQIIHEETVDDHYFYLIKTNHEFQIIEKFNDVIGNWTLLGTSKVSKDVNIFPDEVMVYWYDCPGKLFQSATFTTFKNGEITVDRFFPQVCEPLDKKLSSLVKVNK